MLTVRVSRILQLFALIFSYFIYVGAALQVTYGVVTWQSSAILVPFLALALSQRAQSRCQLRSMHTIEPHNVTSWATVEHVRSRCLTAYAGQP